MPFDTLSITPMPAPDVDAVAGLRAQLWSGGWRPVPLHTNDKRPFGERWQERARLEPPGAATETPHRSALNTGMLADGLRILDLDVDEPAIVAHLRALAIAMLGETLVRSRRDSPRIAMIYRATEGEPGKRSIVGPFGKVEVLGKGQQLHAFGRHPSGATLQWFPESPQTTQVEQVPAITEGQITAFLAKASSCIGASEKPASYDLPSAQRTSHKGLGADPLDVAAALGVIPNTGPVDFDAWNRIGLATFAATDGDDVGRVSWHAWSRKHPAYDAEATEERWQSYVRHKDRVLPDGKEPIGAGTLFDLARKACPGWVKPSDIHKDHAEASEDAPWLLELSELSILRSDPAIAPSLAVRDVFPEFWAGWIEDAAESKGAPADFVALALLSAAGALIGNARWANPWEGWQEPPALNVALVGNPSSGKSPALDAISKPLSDIEAMLNDDWKERKREHATEKAAAAEKRARWEADVKEAIKKGCPAPLMPADADEPETPQRRRIYSTDPTVEKAARQSAANPRGMLMLRDELAGWIAGMDRFNSGAGSDRAFWLQAFGGRPWTPDRVKDGDAEVAVPNLTWGVVGGIQPDRLASLLLMGDDDGMAARFLYGWPAQKPPRRPPECLNVARAQPCLTRLRALPWPPPVPVLVPFDRGAQAALQEWREEIARLEISSAGLFLSWLGKLPGFAVRLSLIFAYLDWCADGHSDPPDRITARDLLRALAFLADYAIPMARRCFGEAALPQVERDARRLARWLVSRRPLPEIINARKLRLMGDGPGIADAERLTAALKELEAFGLVRPAPSRAGSPGRNRADWAVNPKLADVLP